MIGDVGSAGGVASSCVGISMPDSTLESGRLDDGVAWSGSSLSASSSCHRGGCGRCWEIHRGVLGVDPVPGVDGGRGFDLGEVQSLGVGPSYSFSLST